MKHQSLLTILFFLLLILAAWWGAWPTAQTFMALTQSNAAVTEAEGLATKLTATTNEIHQGYDVAAARAADYLKAVSEKVSQANLIEQLQAMAARAGIVINSMSVDINKDQRRQAAGQTVEGLKVVPINLSLTGGYNQLKAFLTVAESNLPVLSGQMMSLAGSGGGAEGAQYKMSVGLETYE